MMSMYPANVPVDFQQKLTTTNEFLNDLSTQFVKTFLSIYFENSLKVLILNANSALFNTRDPPQQDFVPPYVNTNMIRKRLVGFELFAIINVFAFALTFQDHLKREDHATSFWKQLRWIKH